MGFQKPLPLMEGSGVPLQLPETQGEEQNHLPKREYYYSYGYCNTHQSQSYQNIVDESQWFSGPAWPESPGFGLA